MRESDICTRVRGVAVRLWLFPAPVLTAAVLTLSVTGVADTLDIVRDGKSVATIVQADDIGAQLRTAVGVLRDCIEESSGARLDVASAPPETGNVIYIGSGPWVDAFGAGQAGLDDDGFEILFPDARSVLILGPTAWGTEFGVYEFLERYVGVRWLTPGREGTHIPQSGSIRVPQAHIRQEPVFFERSLSGFTYSNADHLAWMRTARVPWRHNRVSFHHSLQGLFPPKTYVETHPEFYPLLAGERWRLGKGVWQPCFSAPGIAEEAAQRIIHYLGQNPSIRTYSLGINDGPGGWCECEGCQAHDSGRINSLGVPDYADLYHAWCSRVADIVLKQYPEVWFGCLAYNNVFDPPTATDVHPRLIPYLCMDRMQWADPKRREQGHESHENWHRRSRVLGWYDYIYGKQYSLPRVYLHQIADNLRFAQRNGVGAFYAEAYPPNDPNWGEGPKLYVTCRLLWNPRADVDALLRDWFVSFAGEDAADDLASYYRHWEDFWTRRVLTSRWFGETGAPDYRLRQYLDFYSSGYHQVVTLKEMAQCRRWLQAALAKTRTGKQRARVRLLLSAFEGYEDAALYYQVNTGETSPTQVLTTLLQSDAPQPQRRKAEELLAVFGDRATVVSRNASFEEGDGDKPDHWFLWWYEPDGVIKWTEDTKAHTGKKCLLVKGIRRGGPVQQVPVEPGRYVMLASCMVPAGQTVHEIQMSVSLKDAQGKDLHKDTYSVEPIQGRWRTIARGFSVPERVGDSVVASAQFVPVVNDLGPLEEVRYDDVRVCRLPDWPE